MSGNVKLIDPNESNINGNIVNGAPKYEDMYISVDLVGIRRGRTVLETDIDTKLTTINQDGGVGGDMRVSFLGENQDPKNPAHSGKFTTNWYDGSSDTNKTHEGFGISNIDIITNSSFIPQINIEFIDIRGLAFFNRENSPYRILFDFPPPIFQLTVKGYYGKAITYKMHLVKYQTEFKAETGNFHISCEFIAVTYAPLTDVLFRYAIQAPFMNGEDAKTSSDPSSEPANTWDLILKLENLYSALPKLIKADADNAKLENTQAELKEYARVFDRLSNFGNTAVLSKNAGTPTLMMFDESQNSNTSGNNKIINRNFGEYDQYIKSLGVEGSSVDVEQHLYIGYVIDNGEEGSNDALIKNNSLKEKLNAYRKNILSEAQQINSEFKSNDIDEAIVKNYNDGGDETISSAFVGIDITKLYIKLVKTKTKLDTEKADTIEELNIKINGMIHDELGMLPTIYNVFKILLNDVDTFFDVLRKTSKDAQTHHNLPENKNIIINGDSYKDIKRSDSTIFPFPLVVRKQKICNQEKEERIAPMELSDSLKGSVFPELIMVQDFIDSFIKSQRLYRQATLKLNTDSNGDYKWIPFTPSDSTLVTPNIKSPYFGKDGSGGSTNQQPLNLSQSDKLSDVFDVLLKRFYILSQNTLSHDFYGLNDDNASYLGSSDVSKTYVKLYAQAEAINLANSISNENYGNLLKLFSENIVNSNDIENFYRYLESNLHSLYSDDEEKSYPISNGYEMYKDKENGSYKGFSFIEMKDIATRVGSGKGDIFDKFVDENKNAWYEKNDNIDEDTYEFTQENIVLRKDSLVTKDETRFNTKFILPNTVSEYHQLFNENKLITKSEDQLNKTTIKFVGSDNNQNFNYVDTINDVSSRGNLFFHDKGLNYGDKIDAKNRDNANIIDVWGQELGFHDVEMSDVILKYLDSQDLTSIVYLSNFGHTLSPFNYYPLKLNRDFFLTPSIVELPIFVRLYMGSLVGIEKNDKKWKSLYDFFTTGGGKNIDNGGILMFSDIHDINQYLSVEDKKILSTEYIKWVNSSFINYAQSVANLYNNVNDRLDEFANKGFTGNALFGIKKISYMSLLNPDDGNDGFKRIIDSIIKREGLIIFNDITFRYQKSLPSDTYVSLRTINNGSDDESIQKKKLNSLFFNEFFIELKNKIDDRIDVLNQETREFELSTGDDDIMTQTYYSFKNLSDKWISGLDNSDNENKRGYPFKDDSSKALIDQFAFVDRAMKPIGDTIIDPQILIDAKNSPDTSIFTVISQLLSLNGFEFFPLQNFLDISDGEWEDSFKIQTGSVNNQYPIFVSMYLGGSSSYPTGIEKYHQFENDGIVDLANPQVKDFLTGTCDDLDITKDNQVNNLPVVNNKKANMLDKVRAFKVRYAEQNQNMFHDYKIDSKEYPETNESIQILSNLAGDNRENAPVSKSQSLYSTYENRAYKATISGFGNAMIQPTQYFQLENVPLFNGAYVILSVEHNITPNKMTTKFSGTKILKYPIPRVTNPAAIVGFEGGNTSETNASEARSTDSDGNSVTLGTGTAGNPKQAKYNSMYNLEIL